MTDGFLCKIDIGQCCPGAGLYPPGCEQAPTNALQLQDEPKRDLLVLHVNSQRPSVHTGDAKGLFA